MTSQPKRRGRPRKNPLPGDQPADKTIVQGEDSREDQQILAEVTDRFDALAVFANGIANGKVRAVIVSGAAGIGKTYTIDSILSKHKTDGKIKFTVVKGFMTAAMLYRLLYENREPNHVIMVDDCDSIFWNDDALNILKAALDTGERRLISYRAMNIDGGDDIPNEFEYQGAMIFTTNIDFHYYIAVAKNRVVEHLKALLNRCQYLNMKLHHHRSVVLWVNHMVTTKKMLQGHPHGMTEQQSRDILSYLLTNSERIPYLSLRTAVKAVELVKLDEKGWRRLADFTLRKQD